MTPPTEPVHVLVTGLAAAVDAVLWALVDVLQVEVMATTPSRWTGHVRTTCIVRVPLPAGSRAAVEHATAAAGTALEWGAWHPTTAEQQVAAQLLPVLQTARDGAGGGHLAGVLQALTALCVAVSTPA